MARRRENCWEDWQVWHKLPDGAPTDVYRNGCSVGPDAMRRIAARWPTDRWRAAVVGYRQHRAVMRRLHRTYPARWKRHG